MLDFSVSEIGLIGVVALIAIGPERLPKVARTAGILLGRFRRYALSVKAEIDREIQQSELNELHKKMNEAAREAERQVASSSQEAEKILNSPVAPTPPSEGVIDIGTIIEAPIVQEKAVEPSALTPAVSPFGGDPFSARPAAPLRSKPMAPPSNSTVADDLAGPEAS